MNRVARAAGKVPTSLWINPEQIANLVDCGRSTACFSLLELIWSKHQKDTADAKEAAAAMKAPAPAIPPPTDPASKYHEIYNQIKDKWIELQNAIEPDAAEEAKNPRKMYLAAKDSDSGSTEERAERRVNFDGERDKSRGLRR
jgi:hypothetical protein